MIAIIKYNAGNIRSVQNAISRLGYKSIITDNHQEILNADKVIFPGVGEASSAMQYLKDKGLDKLIVTLKQPLLGICLGLQLLCKDSEEGNTQCLGVFDASTKRFPPKDKVPHMGWNNFIIRSAIDLFKNIPQNNDVYFVHGYYAEVTNDTLATSNYILTFSSIMKRENFYAMQFHPEKSADIGSQLLKNFLTL